MQHRPTLRCSEDTGVAAQRRQTPQGVGCESFIYTSLHGFPANLISPRKPNHVPLKMTEPGGLRTKAQPDPATLSVAPTLPTSHKSFESAGLSPHPPVSRHPTGRSPCRAVTSLCLKHKPLSQPSARATRFARTSPLPPCPDSAQPRGDATSFPPCAEDAHMAAPSPLRFHLSPTS